MGWEIHKCAGFRILYNKNSIEVDLQNNETYMFQRDTNDDENKF